MPKSEADKIIGEFSSRTEAIKKNGHYVGGNALQPTHTATTVRVRNGKLATTEWPSTETKELIAGYTLIQVKSREEALAWTRRFPNPDMRGADCEIEVRQMFEMENFGRKS